MKANYKLWIWWVKYHIIPLIQLQKKIYLPIYTPFKILYLPIYIAPKLLLLRPSFHSLFKIILKDDLHYIAAHNKEYLYIRIGLDIRFYILDLLDELFQIILPLSNNLFNINIYISFSTREFSNGTHKIHLFKERNISLNDIIELLLDKLHLLDQKYNILYIHTIRIKIIYGK